MNIEKNYKWIFLIILIIAIITRVAFIDKLPMGVHEDEAGMMYDAICMANEGTDRYEMHNPVYLINFGGGQSVMYAFLASILIKIFGFSIFIARLPMALFSILSIILIYFMVKRFKGIKMALLVMLLLTINPWHIMASRWGLDCNLLPSFLIISIFGLIMSKKWWHYVLTGISFGLTLYTYALSYIIVPAVYLVLIITMIIKKQIKIKQILFMIIPILILAFPLVLTQIINILKLETIDLGFITLPRLHSYRASEIGICNILPNLNPLKTNNIWQLLFTNDHNQFNSLKEFGTIYYILIPFSIIGFITLIEKQIKEKEFNLDTVMLYVFITAFASILLFSDLQLYKLNTIFIPLIYFTSIGIKEIYNYKKKIIYVLSIILIITFISFIAVYNEKMSNKNDLAFNSDVIELSEYIKEKYNGKKVHYETDAIQSYIYVLIGTKTKAKEFNSTKKVVKMGTNYWEVTEFENYSFWPKLSIEGNEIQEDTIYVIEDDNIQREKNSAKIREKLEEKGFKYIQYGKFKIYEKKIGE